MESKEDKGYAGTLPIALVLTLLAGFVFTYSLPYRDQRPAVGQPLKIAYDAVQDVDARLWQDPFVAISHLGDSPRTETTFHAIGEKGDSFRLELVDSGSAAKRQGAAKLYKGDFVAAGDPVSIIVVTLSGSPYQDAAEQRMRWRYAILSALANQDIVPMDEQHIGYFEPMSATFPQKRVPFEWWKRSQGRQKALLLWVDEAGLSGRPALKLNALLSEVYEAGTAQLNPKPAFQYTVIGPNSSTLLREMIKESAAELASAGRINNETIQYFSAAATASDQALLNGDKDCRSVSECLSRKGVNLLRTTVTDDKMMALLVEELANRGVDSQSAPDQAPHIAILSEWDTFYGRTMRSAFKAAWGDRETVHGYSYMRGLDGVLPGQEPSNGNGDNNKGKSAKTENNGSSIEYPEGRNQKDYLRRLAGKIAGLDRSLKDSGHKRGVAAIGVLGSDVHDKLLILEALRQYFPHKLFFTTDLDAIYSHPAKWRQTHNMLVASSFDLALRDELQGSIPPFRDVYQTAMFFTAQLALTELAQNTSQLLRPQMFEIGRGRAIPLSMSGDRKKSGSDGTCGWDNFANCEDQIQPLTTASAGDSFNWKDICVIAAGALLVPLISWGVRSKLFAFASYARAYPLKVSGAGIILGLAAGLIYGGWTRYLTHCNPEPNEWFEGVSIWPSQWLRLAAFGFAIAFYFWGSARIAKMERLLQARRESESDGHTIFALPEYATDVDLLKEKPCNVLFVGSWTQDISCRKDYLDPNVLWQTYLSYRNKKKLRLKGSRVRVVVHSLAFLIFAMVLFLWSDRPNTPARGEFAFIVNGLVLLLSVPVTIGLTMWVVQNARLCERFIHCLTEKPSRWNETAKEFAVNNKNIAGDCVEEWLDIRLVVLLTKSMQPLIWGPIVCTAFLMLARSPAIDDWDTPWGLVVVFITMLTYAFSTEMYLQQGAKAMRRKVIEQWNSSIRARRNQSNPDPASIERIQIEIDNVRSLREGAFRPWYEWPLLQSFGGFGSIVLMLQYLMELLGGN
ncbi:hypothetical protein [Methylomonas sp. MgM2]